MSSVSHAASRGLSWLGRSFEANLELLRALMHRYGWCPDEYVAPDEPRYDWLRHFPSGYSITHLEMYVQSLPPQTHTRVR
jgi:hypothetical protein